MIITSERVFRRLSLMNVFFLYSFFFLEPIPNICFSSSYFSVFPATHFFFCNHSLLVTCLTRHFFNSYFFGYLVQVFHSSSKLRTITSSSCLQTHAATSITVVCVLGACSLRLIFVAM